MSIQIVPVIDSYITQFIIMDESIPRIITETKEIISEYLNKNCKVSFFIIDSKYKLN